MKLKGPWLCNNSGVLQYVQTELSTFLCGVDLWLSGRRQELEILYQTSQSNAKNWQCKNNSRTAPSPNSKWKVPEIIAIGLNLGLLFQEPLWPEFFRVFPVGRVVGEPPGIDQDLALSWNVEASKLGIMKVHVWDK